VLALLQQISKVDGDADQERLAPSLAPVVSRELAVKRDCGVDGIHCAAERREETIPNGIDDFSRMLWDGFAGDLPEFPEVE
jgi:hypothetical protein